ncbi:hypothetical protein [Kitasatospora paranensis]|uniref:hypothetical protein n=1 Tax=Kitasatospora paranensis TaxID=258053 RepID=UPI0031F06DB0
MADAARRRAFTVKALVAALAVTAVGGVAFAAGTGGLPRALGGGTSAARTPAAVHATTAGTAGPGRRSGGAPSAGTSGRPDATGRPSASAGTTTPGAPASLGPAALPELTGLCRAYLDREAPGRRRDLLTDLRFAPLVAAAGGVDRVDAYCTVLATVASPSASRSPGREPTTGPGKGDRTKTPLPSVTRGGTEDGAGPG